MNFEAMWSVNKHSDLLFWEIGIPVMIVVIPLFLWSDFTRMGHYFEKRLMGHKIKKVRFCRDMSKFILYSQTMGLGVQVTNRAWCAARWIPVPVRFQV